MSDNRDLYEIAKAIGQSYEDQCRETGSFSTGGIVDAIEAAGFKIVRARKAKSPEQSK